MCHRPGPPSQPRRHAREVNFNRVDHYFPVACLHEIPLKRVLGSENTDVFIFESCERRRGGRHGCVLLLGAALGAGVCRTLCVSRMICGCRAVDTLRLIVRRVAIRQQRTFEREAVGTEQCRERAKRKAADIDDSDSMVRKRPV